MECWFSLVCFAQLCIRQMHYILRGSKHLVKFLVHSSFGLQVKNRWAGKTIVDLFTDEFKGRSRDYYVWCHYFFRISCTILFLFITRHCGYIISLSALQSYFVEMSIRGLLLNEVSVVSWISSSWTMHLPSWFKPCASDFDLCFIHITTVTFALLHLSERWNC